MSNRFERNDELYHFGIKGQKWGKRQYQYEDGSLTPEGRIHYGYDGPKKKLSSEGITRKEKNNIRNKQKEAILNSNDSHNKKAKALAKQNSHAEASKEYEKSGKAKRRAANIMAITYPIVAKMASNVLASEVAKGTISKASAMNIGQISRYTHLGMQTALRYSAGKDFKESWNEFLKS